MVELYLQINIYFSFNCFQDKPWKRKRILLT